MKHALLLAVCVVAACAPGNTTQQARESADVVSAAELHHAWGSVSLYEALLVVRPSFLQSRGGGDSITVASGQFLVGGVNELTRIPVDAVKSVRRLTASEAEFEFGSSRGRPTTTLLITYFP